jgi:glycerol-3-phosphate acyltransferase PlsY
VAWPAAIGFAVIWLAVAALARYSSLAALIASALTPVLLWSLDRHPEAVLFALLAAMIWVMHRANIKRLLRGTEPKIGKT